MSNYWDDRYTALRDYGRVYCPMCYCTFPDIVEEEDRKKVLYTFGFGKRMYAKKFRCKKCHYEWS